MKGSSMADIMQSFIEEFKFAKNKAKRNYKKQKEIMRDIEITLPTKLQ